MLKQLRRIVFGLGFAIALASFTAWADAPGAPANLRVNDVVEPVGTGVSVSFGWFVNDTDTNEIQSAYQILVASSKANLAANSGDLWDSGKVASRSQNHVAYAGPALAADHRIFWKVRTWDKADNAGHYSDPATFVVGLLSYADWAGANWIRRDTKDADDYTYFRKQLALPAKSIDRATVYVSSVHKYTLYLNGTLVGKGPAYHYPQYQYYNAYDVTSLIRANATNQFAILNHWFGGGQGRAAGARGVIMKAVVHYTDGSKVELGTDETWRQTQAAQWVVGRAQHNTGEGVGYIETIDSRRQKPDWTTAQFDDSTWSNAVVIGPQPTAPWTSLLAPDLTRIEETTIAPVAITDLGAGKYVADLGKVYAGLPRIQFSGGSSGTTVNMRGGYALDAAGEIDTRKNQGTDMSYYAILNGNSFTYEPAEYLGMRYLQIDNSPMPVTVSNFAFVVRHSRMDTSASSFDSSDATLNAVWELMKHSLLTCAQEEFVDTPTREKGGFLGDGAIQSSMALPVMNERALTRRVLGEFLQSMDQHWSSATNRGRMNAVYPNRDGARDIPDFTQAYLPWVWSYYMETGDREFLANNFTKFKDIADYVDKHRNAATGLVTNLTGGSGGYRYGIVDWPESMRFGYDMTDARTVINCLAFADFDVVSKIANELGNTADRDLYRTRAETLESAINAQLTNAAGLYVDGLAADGVPSAHVSQHANMFPLALGIVPSARAVPVIDKVKELHMSVGMVTVLWLVRAIGEADEGPHLIDLYTNKSWLGWAQCLSRGATATWESWYSDDAGSESMSHAWGAAGLEGYVRYILGIKPLKPQYEVVQIKPLDFGSKLSFAKGTIPTDRGTIAVDWTRKSESNYTMQVHLPVNVTANIAVPRGAGASPSIYLDGARAEGIDDGKYIWLNGVGSGAHTVVRTEPGSADAPTQSPIK